MYKVDDRGKYVQSFLCPSLKDFASYLLDGKLWFGKYPTPEEFRTILGSGFTHIVDLCTIEEITWERYVTPSWLTKIEYPFEDGSKQYPFGEPSPDPSKWTTFAPFIQSLVDILQMPENKVYLHCLGGHGRSATIAAIVCSHLEQKDAQEVLKDVRDAHQRRKVMKDKWRRLGAPQRNKQKQIVKYYIRTD